MALQFVMKNWQIAKDDVLTFHVCLAYLVIFPNSCCQMKNNIGSINSKKNMLYQGHFTEKNIIHEKQTFTH